MILQVRYRVDAHVYDPQRGGCSSRCWACAQERRAYRTFQAAVEDQPQAERGREAGDQGAIVPPPRRFEVLVTDHSA